MHVRPDDEHGQALAMFVDFARSANIGSVLDVGAGTGRALELLARELPGVKVVGVEPSGALRAIGLAKGIAGDRLIDGNGEQLPFADDEFDFVIETGMLHHVPQPDKVVAEMLRVARLGVMVSDSNKYAQGGPIMRLFKRIVDKLGLWNRMIWVQTFGQMAKWSEGDGVFFSYSVFDNLEQIRARFPHVRLRATSKAIGTNLRYHAAQVRLIATSVQFFYPPD